MSVKNYIVVEKKASRKLDEEFTKIQIEEEKKDLEVKEQQLKINKRRMLILKLKFLRNDILYLAVVALIFAFVLWSWFPGLFTWPRSVALSLVFYLLFEELKLHKMFKGDNK